MKGQLLVGLIAAPVRLGDVDADIAHVAENIAVLALRHRGAEDAAERAGQIDWSCPAVAVDGDAYYSRPAPRLAEGVRQLAHLFHPDAVPDPGLPAIPLGASVRA